jgi:hypothetical protein
MMQKMKILKIFIATTIFLLDVAGLQAQVPSSFMIQGLAQDIDGNALVNQDVEITVTLDGVALQHEPFVTTSSAGVFRVDVGADDLADLLQAGSGFLEVTVNGIPLSTPLLSVPYALVADRVVNDQVEDDDADPTNELQTLSFEDGKLIISGGNEITIPTGETDADADPTNELQTLSFENGKLIISDGNEISIPTGETDADADPTNEIQTLSKEGNMIVLSENGGEVVDEVEDDDADPTNELQVLSYANGMLSISDGNEIAIPTGGTDDDADPTNELQTLTYEEGILSISGGNEIELPTGVADDDPDPTNELQALRLNGNVLEIVSLADGDPSVTLPTGGGGTTPWQTSGSDIYYNAGDVGIGTTNPSDKLHIVGDARVVGDLTIRSGNNNRVLLDGSSSAGEVAVYDKDNRKVAFMRSADNSSWTDPQGDFGYLELKGPNGNPNVKLGFVGTSSEQDRGGIGLYNEVDNNSWWLSPGPSSNPDLGLYYQSGNSFNQRGEFSRTTGMYSAISDRRVKENFSLLSNVMTGVKSLHALSYNYIFDEEKRLEIGFIAQDVQQYFPQLVDEMNGYLGVNYSGLSVVAIKAIQEQQEIIDKQQMLIDQLLERVTKLEALNQEK